MKTIAIAAILAIFAGTFVACSGVATPDPHAGHSEANSDAVSRQIEQSDQEGEAYAKVPVGAVNDESGARSAGLEFAEKTVTACLKSPSSASYDWSTVRSIKAKPLANFRGKTIQRWVVSGSVDALNPLGVRLREPWNVVVGYDNRVFFACEVYLGERRIFSLPEYASASAVGSESDARFEEFSAASIKDAEKQKRREQIETKNAADRDRRDAESTGSWTIDGESFDGTIKFITGDVVAIAAPDGTLKKTAIAKMSDADRQRVEEWKKRVRK